MKHSAGGVRKSKAFHKFTSHLNPANRQHSTTYRLAQIQQYEILSFGEATIAIDRASKGICI